MDVPGGAERSAAEDAAGARHARRKSHSVEAPTPLLRQRCRGRWWHEKRSSTTAPRRQMAPTRSDREKRTDTVVAINAAVAVHG